MTAYLENQNLVLQLPDSVHFTPELFFEFCMANRNLPFKFELIDKGKIVISMTTPQTNHFNLRLASAILMWNDMANLGICFGNDAGFTMPDQKVFSPDAAFITWIRWNKLTTQDHDKFTKIVPDFVLEIRSKTDSLEEQKEKMQKWIAYGVKLAWLIDTYEEKVFIYRQNGNMENFNHLKIKLLGENILLNLEIDLEKILEKVKQ